jgi:glutathione peroxidase
MMEKSVIKGSDANIFFRKLYKATGQAPQWNFSKYLISRNGSTITAFESSVTPEQLDGKIRALLGNK